jgi:hypothetical protein
MGLDTAWIEHWEVDALEVTVGSMQVAWTSDDEVYVYTEQTKQQSTREDGYIFIGNLEWEDMPVDGDWTQEEANNLERLRNFALDWKQGINK